MGLSKEPRFTERLSSRVRMLALFLPALLACDSDNSPQQTQPSVSAAVSTSASADPVALEPIKEPVICVNGPLTDGKQDVIHPRVRQGLEQFGSKVFRVNPDNFQEFKDSCNGVMTVGGNDIDTRIIPQKAPLHPKVKLMSEQRQAFDKILIDWSRANKVPILAECLGAQEVAVWEGKGAGLVQHIPDESVAEKVNHRGFHVVRLDENAAVFGYGRSVTVKSNHHQAPRDPLPDTLKVVGRTKDGMVEAFISTDQLVWGYHWHPKVGEEQVIYRNYVSMVREKGYRSPIAKELARQKQRVGVSPPLPAETVDAADSSSSGKCPSDMVDVKSEVCVDRYESSLVDAGNRAFSPYYSPNRQNLLRDFAKWSKLAGTSELPEGSTWTKPLLDSTMKVPSPYAWQLKENVQARALSRKGVLPNGYLSQGDARQACENVGKRLCTNDEWETACKGEKGRDYPYGSQYQRGRCNVFRFDHPAQSLHGSAAINHHDPRLNLVEDRYGRPLLRITGATMTCVSKWGDDGIYDMVGNIDEWVDDSPVFKGGFYSRSTKAGCNATFGFGHGKGYYDYSLGVRCCK